MRATFRVASAALLALAAAACAPADRSEPPPPAAASRPAERRDERVATDRTRYRMVEGPYGPQATIVTTFTAPPDRPVHIVNCNGAISTSLQESIGGEWVHVWGAEMNACFSEPIVVPAGGRRTERVVAASGAHAAIDGRMNSTRIDGGTYRVVWDNVFLSIDPRARPWGEELPIAQRASAPFTIDPPAPRDPSKSSPAAMPRGIVSVTPAHGSRAAARDPIRIRFGLREAGIELAGTPQLFVDRGWIETPRVTATEDVPPSTVEIEYTPPGGWPRGLHEARVVYLDQQKETRWYAWSFTVP